METRSRTLLVVALVLAAAADLVGYGLAAVIPCEELGCIGTAIEAGAIVVLAAGIGFGFLVRAAKELWAPALCGVLVVGFLFAWIVGNHLISGQGVLPTISDAPVIVGEAMGAGVVIATLAGLTGKLRKWGTK